MRSETAAGRVSYVFLCLVPLLLAVAGIRAFRIPGVYQSAGVVLFAAIVAAAWILGLRKIRSGAEKDRRLALTGGLLLTPLALILLLWVGLGTPWEADAAENQMRYAVLLAGSIAVAAAFITLREALSDAGERFYSTLAYAAGLLAGAAYLFWISFELGAWTARTRAGQISPAIAALGDVFDTLLFTACVLTYLATAAFAASFGRARWLGRGASAAYLAVSFIALIFLALRGLSFPDPTSGAAPWYASPGFIAGIPAVPWIMPYLFGVSLLRRAGAKEENTDR